MTRTLTMQHFADRRHVWLELDSTVVDNAWTASQRCSTPWSRWNTYLNLQCILTFLQWLREECELKGQIWPHAQVLTCWGELVNGIAVKVDNMRWVLIPSDTLDQDILYVDQEWIDIPEWVADYYLAINLNPEDGWMQIWGFTTHQILKAQGQYDTDERQYSLPITKLAQDLNTLWLTHELCPNQTTHTSVKPLAALTLSQAHHLIDRLGNPETIWPRLSIPFSQWASLLAHDGWRQQLCDRRQGLQPQWSITRWLQDSVSDLPEQLGWRIINMSQAVGDFIRPLEASGMRSSEDMRNRSAQEPITLVSRSLTIAGKEYELRVIPKKQSNTWRFELCSAIPNERVPSGFQLRLLTEDLQPFERNEDTATLSTGNPTIEVFLEPGTGLVWETSPLPDDYIREVLRFE